MSQSFRNKWLRQNTTRVAALALTSAKRRLTSYIYYLLHRRPVAKPELVEHASTPRVAQAG